MLFDRNTSRPTEVKNVGFNENQPKAKILSIFLGFGIFSLLYLSYVESTPFLSTQLSYWKYWGIKVLALIFHHDATFVKTSIWKPKSNSKLDASYWDRWQDLAAVKLAWTTKEQKKIAMNCDERENFHNL